MVFFIEVIHLARLGRSYLTALLLNIVAVLTAAVTLSRRTYLSNLEKVSDKGLDLRKWTSYQCKSDLFY